MHWLFIRGQLESHQIAGVRIVEAAHSPDSERYGANETLFAIEMIQGHLNLMLTLMYGLIAHAKCVQQLWLCRNILF